jgi:hypothetical protein
VCARCGADVSIENEVTSAAGRELASPTSAAHLGGSESAAGLANLDAKTRRSLLRLGLWTLLLIAAIGFAPRGFLSEFGSSGSPRPSQSGPDTTDSAEPAASAAPGLGLTEDAVVGVLAIAFGGLRPPWGLKPVDDLRHVRTATADGDIQLDLYGPPGELHGLKLTTYSISSDEGALAGRRAITTFLGLYAPDAVLKLVGAYDDALDAEKGGRSSAKSGDVVARLSMEIAKERAIVVVEPVEGPD